jgi:hypothetical protein
MAGYKGILQHLLRLLDHFLHREFFVSVVQVRDHAKQLSLSMGCPRPTPSKKIRVQFLGDVCYEHYRGFRPCDVPNAAC